MELKNQIGSAAKVPFEFYWSDRSKVDPNFFMKGQPDNYHGTPTYLRQGCLFINIKFGLNDNNCGFPNPFICEIIY